MYRIYLMLYREVQGRRIAESAGWRTRNSIFPPSLKYAIRSSKTWGACYHRLDKSKQTSPNQSWNGFLPPQPSHIPSPRQGCLSCKKTKEPAEEVWRLEEGFIPSNCNSIQLKSLQGLGFKFTDGVKMKKLKKEKTDPSNRFNPDDFPDFTPGRELEGVLKKK